MYQTSDFDLAVALQLTGHKILTLGAIDKESKKYDFFFDETPKLMEDIDAYFNNEMMVDPRKVFEVIRTLKSRLYEMRRA